MGIIADTFKARIDELHRRDMEMLDELHRIAAGLKGVASEMALIVNNDHRAAHAHNAMI